MSRHNEWAMPARDASADHDTGFRIAAYWWVAYAGAAGVLLAALVGLTWLFAGQQAELFERHLQETSQLLAQDLGSRTAALASRLQRWRADETLRMALLDGRDEVLHAKEEALASLYPDVTGVVLLRFADTVSGGPPGERLSYAGMEMARSVTRTGLISPLEAHRVNEHDAHLAIAGPVMDAAGEQVLGVVHLMLPLSLLPMADELQGSSVRYAYSQRVGDQLVAVASNRPDRPDGETVSTSIPVAGTHLLLAAEGEPPARLSTDLIIRLAAFTATAMVLLGVALWLPYRRHRHALKADLGSIVGLAKDASKRLPLRTTCSRLSEFRPVLTELRRLFWESSSAPPAALGPSTGQSVVVDHRRPIASRMPAERTGGAGVEAGTSAHPDPKAAQDAEPVPSAPPAEPATAMADAMATTAVPAGIFRAYDVRGLLGSEINAAVMRQLGLAVGSAAREVGGNSCLVARDQRPSGAALSAALVDGLRASGCDVIDLGIAPTPALYFAAHRRGDCSAAIVTASHNPARYNGLKVVLGGRSASAEQILALRERIQRGDYTTGAGAYRLDSVFDDYLAEIENDVAVARPLKVVIDCGHASASLVAPRLYHALGCDVIELDCDLDPAMADAHMPDPSQPQNLYTLGEAVMAAGADVGLAFDADGDRLGVVDSSGRFIAADRVLMLLAADVLARHPDSAIVYDVKCSHQLRSEILRAGGQPVMWRSGHSFLKQKMHELDAPLGGELSGHIIFRERWNGFDDALYAGARVLELLALDPRPSADLFAELPAAIGTPELFAPLPPGEAQAVMQAVLGMAERLDGVEVTTIDGLRAEFVQGWGLVRASNTQPGLVFRFQGDDDQSLQKIQGLFQRMMQLVAPRLELPF